MKPAELKQPKRVAEPGQAICPRPASREPPPQPPRPWEEIAAAACGLLADPLAGRISLQELRPLASSLDWELWQFASSHRASRAFFAEGVPFGAASNGWLARNVAKVFFAALAGTEQQTILDALSRRREPRRRAQAARSESHAFVEAEGPHESRSSGDGPGS